MERRRSGAGHSECQENQAARLSYAGDRRHAVIQLELQRVHRLHRFVVDARPVERLLQVAARLQQPLVQLAAVPLDLRPPADASYGVPGLRVAAQGTMHMAATRLACSCLPFCVEGMRVPGNMTACRKSGTAAGWTHAPSCRQLCASCRSYRLLSAAAACGARSTRIIIKRKRGGQAGQKGSSARTSWSIRTSTSTHRARTKRSVTSPLSCWCVSTSCSTVPSAPSQKTCTRSDRRHGAVLRGVCLKVIPVACVTRLAELRKRACARRRHSAAHLSKARSGGNTEEPAFHSQMTNNGPCP